MFFDNEVEKGGSNDQKIDKKDQCLILFEFKIYLIKYLFKIISEYNKNKFNCKKCIKSQF